MCRTEGRDVTAQILAFSVNNEPNNFIEKGRKWGAIDRYFYGYFPIKPWQR